VTVADGYGNRVGSYRSRVHFASTDPRASLPADYTFTAADSGSHVFDGVILRTAGRQSVTATDVHTSAVNGSQTGIAVTAGRFAQFLVSELASLRRAGTAGSLRVTATDANGNRVSTFGGTVHFTSSDSAARLPGDYTFTAADAGSHVFAGAVMLGTPGPQWVRVADTTAVERRGDLAVDVEKKPRSR